MDLKIKLPIAPITRLFGLTALLQIILFSLFPIDTLAQKGDSASVKLTCLSKHELSDFDTSVFVSLTTELQPSVFIDNGRVNSFSTTPLCLFTDSDSMLNWPMDLSVSKIELVQIRFTKAGQFQNPIDLSVLSTFPKLKYIHILSEIDTSATAVRALLKNVPSSAVVIFTVAKLT